MRETGFGKILIGLAKSWATFLVILIFGVALSIGFLWLLSKYARCMTYTAIGCLLFATLGGGGIAIIVGVSDES